MAKPGNGIWYVDFPTYQYNEDVKALAKESGLQVVDARFDNGDGAKNTPTLTLVSDQSAAVETKSNEPALVSVYKLTDGVRGDRASKAGIPEDEAKAWIADRPENVYEIEAE